MNEQDALRKFQASPDCFNEINEDRCFLLGYRAREAEVERLRKALVGLRRQHYRNSDDEFYNCDALGSGADGAVSECSCGADEANRRIVAALRGDAEGG